MPFMLLFSRLVISNSLWSQGLQHTRLPCPLLSPRACSDSCPLSQWCIQPSHPLVTPFSSCHQSFPASGSFPTSQLFTSGSQSFGASASASTDWLDLLEVQRTLESLLQHHSSKASILWHSAFFMVQLSCPYMTTRKTIALAKRTFGKVISLLFNMLSRCVIAFLPRSKRHLISWLQSLSAVILGPKKI